MRPQRLLPLLLLTACGGAPAGAPASGPTAAPASAPAAAPATAAAAPALGPDDTVYAGDLRLILFADVCTLPVRLTFRGATLEDASYPGSALVGEGGCDKLRPDLQTVRILGGSAAANRARGKIEITVLKDGQPQVLTATWDGTAPSKAGGFGAATLSGPSFAITAVTWDLQAAP